MHQSRQFVSVLEKLPVKETLQVELKSTVVTEGSVEQAAVPEGFHHLSRFIDPADDDVVWRGDSIMEILRKIQIKQGSLFVYTSGLY